MAGECDVGHVGMTWSEDQNAVKEYDSEGNSATNDMKEGSLNRDYKRRSEPLKWDYQTGSRIKTRLRGAWMLSRADWRSNRK